MRAWVALVAVLFLGCGHSPTEPQCTEQTKVLEVDWGGWLEDFQKDIVASYKGRGWACVDESIRNAWGNRIGTKYTCTICE